MAIDLQMKMNNYFDDKTLAAAIPHGIIVLDHEFNWLWSNNIAKSFFKIKAEPENENIFITLPFLSNYLTKNKTYKDPIIIKHGQQHFALRLIAYQSTNYILMVEDVTHTVKLEKIREVFVSNVSHELRTPLTVFSGYLEMLLEKVPEDKQVLVDILQQMDEQRHRMYLLVEDLLLLSNLEHAELDNKVKEQVEIAPMLEQIINAAKQLGGTKNQTFVVDIYDSATVYGSADELHSAFSNLIYNAAHYTPDGGEIKIHCFYEGKQLIVAIADNGIGIPEKDIEHITERFYRVDKGRSWNKVGGTGLGLAIVKHVLIRHDATLEIASELGKGSCFRCVFN